MTMLYDGPEARFGWSALGVGVKRKSLLVLVSLALFAGQTAEGQEAERLRLSCDGGNATACSYLGVLYHNGEGVAQDLARAASLYQQACDGGYAPAC